MKPYETPVIQVTKLETEDVIMASVIDTDNIGSWDNNW